MWCSEGLECMFDISSLKEDHDAWEKRKILSVLQEEKFTEKEPSIPLSYMIMRAKANLQRRYEIYEFNSQLSMKEVEEAFKVAPQSLVDWIRKNGYKVYSDYEKQNKCLIN